MARGTPVVVVDSGGQPVVETTDPQATHCVERPEGTRVTLSDAGQPVYFPEGSPTP